MLIRSKPLFFSVLSVILLLLVLSVLLLTGNRRQAEQARRDRDQARRDLARFKTLDPYPSEDNITGVRENVDRLEEWCLELSDILRTGQPELRDLTAAAFIESLNAQVNALRRASPRIAGSLVVGEDFNFGFDRYLGSDAELPQEEEVRRLNYQFQIVRQLVELAYEVGVMRVLTVAREPDGGRRPYSLTAGPPDAPEDELYAREPIRLSLRLRQDKLVQLLNRLTTQTPVTVVHELKISKSADDLRPVRLPAERGRPAESPAVLSPFASPEPGREAPAPKTLPREARLVSGPEVDPPLNLDLLLHVYHFKGS